VQIERNLLLYCIGFIDYDTIGSNEQEGRKQMRVREILKRCGFLWVHPILLLHAADTPPAKLYDVPMAMVTYKISGGGMLSEDVNLSIKGEGKLRFRAWGSVELSEKYIEESTVGVLHYREERHRCQKRQEKQILDVDFNTKKIRERPLPEGKKRKQVTAGLKKEGQQMVANVVCDMWQGRGVRRCIYKGIPLFTEYRALGLLYREEATEVQFDLNVTESSGCDIPSYPVEKFALYTGSFKTRNKKTPRSFEERLAQSIEIFEQKGLKEEKLSPAQKQKLLNILADPIYESQKKKLPQLLEILKKSRACLFHTKTTDSANRCIKELVKMKPFFTENGDNHIEDWDKEKDKVLEEIEEHIVTLQSKMKCIRAAKKFSDLAVCMKP
jgi:hypothetical protein